MNLSPEELSHRQVVGYITGTATKHEKDVIEQVRRKNPVWALFFGTVEESIHRHGIRVQIPKRPSARAVLPFEEIERLFGEVFSGTIRKPQAQMWIDALLASPVFFRRWLGVLSEVEPAGGLHPVPGMPIFSMQSDEAILGRLRNSPGCGRRRFMPWFFRATDARRRMLESIEGLSRSMKWGLAFSAVVFFASATILGYRHSRINDQAAPTVFDEQVPHEYDLGSFRSAEPAVIGRQDVKSWTVMIQLGIADYLLREYETALSDFRAAESMRFDMPAGAGAEPVSKWDREAAFYTGLSHLALWRTRRERLSDDVRRLHADEAVRCLFRADSIAGARSLENNDREAYFIGLVYTLQHRKQEAARWLGQIKPESSFYDRSVLLSQGGEEKP
jgi:hypothetical protein